MLEISPHRLKIVVIEPEIPQNTGNIARLCAVSGAELHLVRPLGFFLSERHLKRAGMDYLDEVRLTVHDDLAALRAVMGPAGFWLASAKASKSLWEAEFRADDWLILGRETAGLPAGLLAENAERCVRIPQQAGARCLNLATAAGIFLYEALRQVGLNR